MLVFTPHEFKSNIPTPPIISSVLNSSYSLSMVVALGFELFVFSMDDTIPPKRHPRSTESKLMCIYNRALKRYRKCVLTVTSRILLLEKNFTLTFPCDNQNLSWHYMYFQEAYHGTTCVLSWHYLQIFVSPLNYL